MGDSLFKLGRYNRVFLEIWTQIPIWGPILIWWAVGSFFSRKYSKRAHRDAQTFFLFIKTIKWEKWWSWWLRITNAFILCNLLWKVQKCIAANKEGSFKLCVKFEQEWLSISLKRPLGSQQHVLLRGRGHELFFYNKWVCCIEGSSCLNYWQGVGNLGRGGLDLCFAPRRRWMWIFQTLKGVNVFEAVSMQSIVFVWAHQ